MAYDYNSTSKTFELQNPYKFQNVVFIFCAVVLIAAGMYGLLMSRDYLEVRAYRDAAAPVLCGVVLLGYGLRYIIVAFSRLRFYFGRGRPQPLAKTLAEGQFGATPVAEGHKEMMRHGSLQYSEPKGPLEGLLYHRIPKLITAPHLVQGIAKYLFSTAGVMLALLVAFVVAAATVKDANTLAWLSVFFGAYGIWQVLWDISDGESPDFGVKQLIALIVVAVIAPVGLSLVAAELPDLSAYSFHYHTALLLGLGFLLLVLLFIATIAQINPPPTTEVSCEVHPMSLQCPPASVMDELERNLQAAWVEKIPNRRYAYTKPQTPLHAGSGEFWGEVFEESQPVPLDSTKRSTFSAFADSKQRLMAVSDVFCALLWVAFAVCVVLFFNRYDNILAQGDSWYSLMLVAFILAALARFGFFVTNRLWGRFDFESVLTWVDMQGSFQVASVGTGNQLQSQMQTNSEFVRVENMTLRVWRTRIESVVFGKDATRQVMAMFSTDAEAKILANTLQEYAAAQSVLAAPQSDVDRQKLQSISSADGQLQVAQSATVSALSNAVTGTSLLEQTLEKKATADAVAAASQAGEKFCTECGAKAAAAAKFCGQCGAKLS